MVCFTPFFCRDFLPSTIQHDLIFLQLLAVFITLCISWLQTLVSSLEKKIDDTEKKYDETNKISEERLKKAMDAESKIDDLNMAMLRLFFSLTLLDSISTSACTLIAEKTIISIYWLTFLFLYSASGFKKKYPTWKLMRKCKDKRCWARQSGACLSICRFQLFQR